MYLKELTPWGGLVILILLGVVAAILFLIDRRMLNRVLNLGIRLPKMPRKLWLPVLASLVAVSALTAGILVLSLPCRAFWPAAVTMALCLALSLPRAMNTYHRSLKHTEAHRRYLLANGGTHLESIIPSARRAFRAALLPLLWQRSSPLPLAIALMVTGAIAGGTTTAAALAMGILTWTAAVASSVLAAMLAFWLADRVLFDSRENLKI
jgi:ABC-type iron transport system FetAB permease component